MSRWGARWTAAQITASQQRERARSLDARAVVTAHHSTARQRLEVAVAAVRGAAVEGSYVPGEALQLTLIGAVTLTPNDLFTLGHYRRIAYRKAWHERIYWAVLEVTGRSTPPPPFIYYTLQAQRRARRRCDPDALSGHFKYMIDGLRYAGVVIDDSPRYLRDWHPTQILGEPAIDLLLHAVDADGRPAYAPPRHA